MNARRDRPHAVRGFGHMIVLLILLAALFAGSYQGMELIYRFSGRPPEPWTHILSGIGGLLLLLLIFAGMGIWRGRGGGHDHRRDYGTKLMNDVVDAMARIAQGDFTVLLPINERDPYAQIAENVNKMARELGSMERLRQDFVSNVSHEIQSPLTSIGGFANLLRDQTLTPEKRAHYLDVIETEAKRLSKLSDNLLKLSQLESDAQPLMKTPFLLNKQIENALLMLEPQWAGKGIEPSMSLDRITYTGDESLISQVWINLIHNAIKFTPEGGEIRVELQAQGGVIRFRIEDTGVGLSKEDQMHVFERFYKADKARDRSLGGNGLGLSLVKKIVELHGGSVSVQSEAGEGAAFTVLLPIESA